jgi:putative transport protein
VAPVVKYVFFDLFLFTTGYKVGPQFFRALKKDALPQLALTVVLCVTCLIAAFIAAKLLGYDVGTAAGMLAGAFTESTVIGTAGDAIGRLAISAADKTSLTNNIPVAYAVTYLVGTGFIVWFLPNVGPKLMGVNLEGARVLELGRSPPHFGPFRKRQRVNFRRWVTRCPTPLAISCLRHGAQSWSR